MHESRPGRCHRSAIPTLLSLLLLVAGLAHGNPLRNAATMKAEDHFEGPALALARAAEAGDAAEIANLIAAGNSPDTAGRAAMPLLAWPIIKESPEGLKALLVHGADPNFRVVEHDRERGQARNNVMVFAAALPDPTYLGLLLDHGGDANTLNSNDESLLLVAHLNGYRWDNIQLLVERGADINQGGRLSLITRYSNGAFDRVHWLLEHGADPTVRVSGRYHPPGGSMPVVEDIYWWPVSSDEMIEWQRKCQDWLRQRGIERPPQPERIVKFRRSRGLPETPAISH
ncbi:MAG: ankyrin repeat domain-containing protein [Cyanophyceae cyanobacterium]